MFKHLSIKQKMGTLVASISLFMALVAFVGYYFLNQSVDRFGELSESLLHVQKMGDARTYEKKAFPELDALMETYRASRDRVIVLAQQIKKLVEQNHTSIDNVVGAIDAAIQDITNFGAIDGQISRVTKQVQIIAKAINEMAVGSQRIIGSIKDVENLSRDAAAESQNVSAATEEQSASMEEIASSSQALAKLAADLQSVVATFRV